MSSGLKTIDLDELRKAVGRTGRQGKLATSSGIDAKAPLGVLVTRALRQRVFSLRDDLWVSVGDSSFASIETLFVKVDDDSMDIHIDDRGVHRIFRLSLAEVEL